MTADYLASSTRTAEQVHACTKAKSSQLPIPRDSLAFQAFPQIPSQRLPNTVAERIGNVLLSSGPNSHQMSLRTFPFGGYGAAYGIVSETTHRTSSTQHSISAYSPNDAGRRDTTTSQSHSTISDDEKCVLRLHPAQQNSWHSAGREL